MNRSADILVVFPGPELGEGRPRPVDLLLLLLLPPLRLYHRR